MSRTQRSYPCLHRGGVRLLAYRRERCPSRASSSVRTEDMSLHVVAEALSSCAGSRLMANLCRVLLCHQCSAGPQYKVTWPFAALVFWVKSNGMK